MRAACLSIALAFTSCGGEPEPNRPAPPVTEVSDHSTSSADPPSTGTVVPPSTEAPVPSDPPDLRLVATPGAGSVALSIANHGASAVSLRTAVAIEVDHAGAFAELSSASTLALRYDCEHEAERCVTLAPGAELLPPDWLGTSGDVQCVCTRCAPVEAGSYRFAVTTCDGAHRVESNAFEMSARPATVAAP